MPTPLFLSSGDLIADRRYEFARDLQSKGDLVAAADLLDQTVALAPRFTSAWFALGDMRAELGESDAAISAFQSARETDPDDRHGAAVRLMRLGAAPVTMMPQAYVRSLFDQYAPRFDAELTERLHYRAPELLFKAVLAVRAGQRKSASFKRAIDLGCGTGLGAAAFANNVEAFIGIDLSPGMIEQARAGGLYAALEIDDMTAGLRKQADASADLVLAADAMVYVGEFAAVLDEVQRVLASGGLVALTAETHDGDGVIIGEGLRTAHSADYVRAAIAAAGLSLVYLEPASPRTERGVPVRGLVAVAAKM